MEREKPRSKAPAQKTYTYQFDVAKMKPIPSVGGITIRIAAQSGIGIRYGRCTVSLMPTMQLQNEIRKIRYDTKKTGRTYTLCGKA